MNPFFLSTDLDFAKKSGSLQNGFTHKVHLDVVSENSVLKIPGETERAVGNALLIC